MLIYFSDSLENCRGYCFVVAMMLDVPAITDACVVSTTRRTV